MFVDRLQVAGLARPALKAMKWRRLVSKPAEVVPVWTIATDAAHVGRAAAVFDGAEGLTPERLAQLRAVLSVYADTPMVTVEAHRLPAGASLDRGVAFDAASPLAQQLTTLVRETARTSPDVIRQVETHGETLYKMVVPAKVAAGLGEGLLKSMPSKAVSGGIRGAVMSGSDIVAQASFVPVSAGAGAEVGVAAAGGAGAAGAITVAAPLVLLAVAVAVSVHAERQRREALERITELLEQIRQDALDDERDRLNACQPAVKKATAILLDKGTVGHSLGLDSASYAIDTAVEAATRRVNVWHEAVSRLPERAELDSLREAVPGVDDPNSEFRAHLELAALAISLKRRVVVLQALEHAQLSDGNEFSQFLQQLRREQESLDELEAAIKDLLEDLGAVRLRSPGRIVDMLMTRGQVEELLDATTNLRALAGTVSPAATNQSEVEIEMVRRQDGSVIVLPPHRVA